MTGDTDTPISESLPEPALSTGARLREARAAAGLSLDAVAQQLKLAPRQVKALEDDDFAQLPGRTFVRGFLRNYARLLRLDPDALLASLPEASSTPSLDHPSLSPTTRVMGELPADSHGKPSSARWAIPLAIVAIVAIAVVYEFARPLADHAKAPAAAKATVAPAAPAAPRPGAAPDAGSTGAAPPAPAEAPGPDSAPRSDAAPAAAPAPQADIGAATPVSADTPLVFVFRGTSWIEVKDTKGVIVLSTIGYPGATHAVGGAAPFEVVLGNAEAVAVSWRGAPFDVAPHIKQNVAKFSIK
jgi:cytoskeleton protein RodZ